MTRFQYGMFMAVLLSLQPAGIAQERVSVLDLTGKWKFELGDHPEWAAPDCDDSRWGTVRVPSVWENEGYPGYDGYAWYRKRFRAPIEWEGKALYLRVGRVDDVDEVYVNGHLVGFQGEFPPKYRTAYQMKREYPLAPFVLNPGGENVIAVRVFDSELGGGIVAGPVGIYEDPHFLKADYPIQGTWKISAGDDTRWKDPDLDDGRWASVRVPAFWEGQGLKGYDGFAWYRVRFRLPAEADGRSLILLLGKIDDYDETYLNGEFLGRTGRPEDFGAFGKMGKVYDRLRVYTVRRDLLRPGGENVLAVRVFDGLWHGGIYDGPIGFTTPEKYRDWSTRQGKKEPGWMESLKRLWD